jgi:hypothetical protein
MGCDGCGTSMASLSNFYSSVNRARQANLTVPNAQLAAPQGPQLKLDMLRGGQLAFPQVSIPQYTSSGKMFSAQTPIGGLNVKRRAFD